MLTNRAIYETDLPQSSVTVYMYLCDRANKDKQSFPSLKRIAQDLGISDTTVKRAIKNLENKGLIKKENRFRQNGGKSSNLYTIC